MPSYLCYSGALQPCTLNGKAVCQAFHTEVDTSSRLHADNLVELDTPISKALGENTTTVIPTTGKLRLHCKFWLGCSLRSE
jgi:hypothetical protein